MKTTPPDQTHSLPDTSNPSESALRKTFQKLLRKRSSKASKKLEKDLQHSSSKWQSYMQSSTQNAHLATDQPRFDDILPLRQPRLSADTEEVCHQDEACPFLTAAKDIPASGWCFITALQLLRVCLHAFDSMHMLAYWCYLQIILGLFARSLLLADGGPSVDHCHKGQEFNGLTPDCHQR